MTRIEGNSPWTLHIASDEGPAEGSVQFSHFDLIEIGFDPIKILSDPINGQTFGSGQSGLDDHFDVGQRASDQSAAVDLIVDHVRPEDDVGFVRVEEVERDRVLQVGDERFDVVRVQVDAAQLVTVAEDDVRSDGIVALARETVHFQLVAREALAFVFRFQRPVNMEPGKINQLLFTFLLLLLLLFILKMICNLRSALVISILLFSKIIFTGNYYLLIIE